MTKAIFFDFGQTLVDSADGFREAERIAKQHIYNDLFPGENDEQYQKFLTEYRSVRKRFHKCSNFSRPAIWQAVYGWANRPAPHEMLLEMETEYWQVVKSRTTPFPEALTVLEKLSKRFKLAVITNTQGMKGSGAHRITLYPEFEQLFGTIIVAGESGIPAKPDPEPFRLCLEKMDIDPAEAIYVGDDYEKDVCGAAHAGIRPVWIKHSLVKRSWPKPQHPLPHTTITNLIELIDITTHNT